MLKDRLGQDGPGRGRMGWLAALAAVGAMAGCSDSSSDIVPQLSYDDLTEQYDAIREASSSLPITDPGALPLSGGATYDGVMVLSTDGTDGLPSDMAGEMTLRADFGDDSLSGSVNDVITDGEDHLEGSLAISDGEIDRDADVEANYTYDFDMGGTLTEDDGTELEVDAVGAGDFLGDDRQRSAGKVDGVISSDRGASLLGGGFVLTR